MTILSQNAHRPGAVKGGGGYGEPSHGEPGRSPLQRHRGTPVVSPGAAFDALPGLVDMHGETPLPSIFEI